MDPNTFTYQDQFEDGIDEIPKPVIVYHDDSFDY